MSPADPTRIAVEDAYQMVRRWEQGDAYALDALLPAMYADLRALAARRLAAQDGYQTLQPTALLNETLLRLLGAERARIADGEHLFRLAARTMRQILVDRARRSARDKHGGDWQREDLTQALSLPLPEHTDLGRLDEAIGLLEELDERLARVVELRYFVGLSVPEVAGVMGVDERTVYRDWALARSWLRVRLEA